MGQTRDQIESYIETRREDLGSKISELESKVKSVTDWRQHFQKNPATLVGLAFGGGILLATMLGGRKRHRSGRTPSTDRSSIEGQKSKVSETLDHIKIALIGVAATRIKDIIGDLVPGFHEQLQHAESQHIGSSSPNRVV